MLSGSVPGYLFCTKLSKVVALKEEAKFFSAKATHAILQSSAFDSFLLVRT